MVEWKHKHILEVARAFYFQYGSGGAYWGECIKTFGCLCNVATSLHGRNKFMPCSQTCVFIRYPFDQKAYKELNLENKQIFVSQNVTFHETSFLLHSIKPNSPISQYTSLIPIVSNDPVRIISHLFQPMSLMTQILTNQMTQIPLLHPTILHKFHWWEMINSYLTTSNKIARLCL